MKKIFLTVLILCFLVQPAYAQLKNLFASWYTVTTTETTISLPYSSRSITILNQDSANNIAVSFDGTAIGSDLVDDPDTNTPAIIQLASGEDVTLDDFETKTIKLRLEQGGYPNASPVSVIVTY